MIYFVMASRPRAVKIGYSAKPAERIASLQSASAARLKLLGVCPGTREDESNLHARFADCRIRGEWFRASPELLAVVKTLCAGHRLHGRCQRCGVSQVPLHESASNECLVCDDCDPPGMPRTLRRSKEGSRPISHTPAGGGFRISHKKPSE